MAVKGRLLQTAAGSLHAPGVQPSTRCPASLGALPRRYVRIFQVCLMAFVVATCYLNIEKDTLDNGGCWLWPVQFPFTEQWLVSKRDLLDEEDCWP